MSQFPTLDRNIVISIAHALETLGADVQRLVEACELSAIWTEPGREVLPEHHVWRLFEQSADSLRMPDLGLRVGAKFEIRDLGRFGEKLASSLTSYHCLHDYIKSVNRYSSHSRFWLEQQRGGVWFCRQGIDLIEVGRNEVEQFALELMIRLVQLGCGPTWAPRRVLVQHTDSTSYLTCPNLSNAEAHFGQAVTAIWIPSADLSQRVRWHDDELTGRVRESIRLNLRDAVPSLPIVAQQLGFSVRGLQRALSARQLDWSRLLDQIRLDMAAQFLETDMSITSIAHELGYTDQANFGRAFRRWTGTTPYSYRKQVRGDASR